MFDKSLDKFVGSGLACRKINKTEFVTHGKGCKQQLHSDKTDENASYFGSDKYF